MTLKSAKNKFRTFKRDIIEHNEINWNEVEILIDFIDPYVKVNNSTFTHFTEIIYKCKKENKISSSETMTIVREIDNILEFLKVESITESILLALFVSSAIGVAAYYIAKSFLI